MGYLDRSIALIISGFQALRTANVFEWRLVIAQRWQCVETVIRCNQFPGRGRLGAFF
jgi:hypothetical protein